MRKSKIKMAMCLLTLTGLLSITGCKKEKLKKEEPISIAKTEDVNLSKLIKFLSITASAPIEQVVYNEKDKEFVIYGWYHQSLAQTLDEYKIANEYKATYEK